MSVRAPALFCVGLLAVAGWIAVDHFGDPEDERSGVVALEAQAYTCPMHPQVLQHEPGICPLCRMDLVPAAAAADRADEQAYTCPMHPQVLQHEPGICPLCRMDLVPVETGAPEGEHRDDAPGVHVSPGFLQRFGVRTTSVERGSLPVEIRTIGILAHNERNLFSVNTKISGWIEQASVNNVGEQVQAGEALFEIYSPELVATQQDYLTAMDYVAQLQERGASGGAIERAGGLLDAARERLSTGT